MKAQLILLVMLISPVTLIRNLFRRQSLDSTVLTSTTMQSPLLCGTVDTGFGCYPISQCSAFSARGVYFVKRGYEICGWDSVTKEPYLCCNKILGTTTPALSTTTPGPSSECAKITTRGSGVSYMAALFDQNVDLPKIVCDASIISRRSLLTAAHCFRVVQNRETSYGAFIGDSILNLEGSPIEVDVERIIRHPDYHYPNVYNDIAIVVLKTALNYNERIAPVCLPSKEQVNETFAGLDAVVTGWGQYRLGGPLQSAVIPVITQQECQNASSGLSAAKTEIIPDGITTDILCTGLYNITRNDTCLDGSGGPLVTADENGLHWIQIGIVASGFLCGDVYPGLYTRTTQYLDWIATNIVP